MSGDELAVVHNGIIENYLTLREELTAAAGYVFASDTDSEVVAHLVHSCLKGKGTAGCRSPGGETARRCLCDRAVLDEPTDSNRCHTRSGCPLR